MLISRSRSQQPIQPPLEVNGVLVKKECSLKVLGVTLDTKLTNGRHIKNTCHVTFCSTFPLHLLLLSRNLGLENVELVSSIVCQMG